MKKKDATKPHLFVPSGPWKIYVAYNKALYLRNPNTVDQFLGYGGNWEYDSKALAEKIAKALNEYEKNHP